MQAKLIAKACAAGLIAASVPALATFHLMKVVEVFPGTAAAPSAQYVVIQMYASGQNLVGGHAVTVFNAAGTLTGTFTFPGSLPNGANQAKILIATSQAESFFGLTADLIMSASVLSAGGKVCWAGTLDCVAWGAYSGSSAGVGTPFNASTGLTSGRAAARRLNIAGSTTLLDAGDDTDNSANDFVFASPAPRNNAGVLGTIPPATCGNGTIEGLEQCDDHNLVSGDGCSASCMLETPVVTRRPVGDYDGDGKSDVVWRNASTGANAIWKSANAATQQAVTSVSDQNWKVVGRGDFNGDGKADLFWRNASTGSNSIWKSANSATPQAVTAVTTLSWKVVGIGDFDNDGKADVLWRNASTGANAIWKSGNASTQQAVTTVTDLNWQVVGIGDFNGDGKSDLFWRNTSTGSNAVWLSANSVTRQVVSAVTTLTWMIVPREGQALGTIATNGPMLSIADVSIVEGNSGTKTATFTISLSQAATAAVTYNIATANGTAMAGSDYEASSLTGESIAAGSTSKSFAVTINGDTTVEGSEVFSVNVSNVVGAMVADGSASGTILNDDSNGYPG